MDKFRKYFTTGVLAVTAGAIIGGMQLSAKMDLVGEAPGNRIAVWHAEDYVGPDAIYDFDDLTAQWSAYTETLNAYIEAEDNGHVFEANGYAKEALQKAGEACSLAVRLNHYDDPGARETVGPMCDTEQELREHLEEMSTTAGKIQRSLIGIESFATDFKEGLDELAMKGAFFGKFSVASGRF